MRFFIDAEFHDTGTTIELISIAVVPEEGDATFYAENSEYDWNWATPWLIENVKPHLDGHSQAPPHAIGLALRDWITAQSPPAEVEFWGWCSGYDYVLLCQLYGTMLDKPPGWPNYIGDIQQVLDLLGIPDEKLAPKPAGAGRAHHALADAEYVRHLWRWLRACHYITRVP